MQKQVKNRIFEVGASEEGCRRVANATKAMEFSMDLDLFFSESEEDEGANKLGVESQHSHADDCDAHGQCGHRVEEYNSAY